MTHLPAFADSTNPISADNRDSMIKDYYPDGVYTKSSTKKALLRSSLLQRRIDVGSRETQGPGISILSEHSHSSDAFTRYNF